MKKATKNCTTFILPNGTTLNLKVNPALTVYDLKQLIYKKTGQWYNIPLSSGIVLGESVEDGLHDQLYVYSLHIPGKEIFMCEALGIGGDSPRRTLVGSTGIQSVDAQAGGLLTNEGVESLSVPLLKRRSLPKRPKWISRLL